jgi:hypothetical protein
VARPWRDPLDAILAKLEKQRPQPAAEPPARVPMDGTESGPVVIGVDPGQTGALAVLDLGGRVVRTTRMPVIKGAGSKTELDGPAIIAWVRAIQATHEIRLVAVERTHSMPKQGLSSTYAFGYGCGRIRGILEVLCGAVELVPPEQWVRAVLKGQGGGKAATLQFARRRWPDADLVGSNHAGSKPSSGIADALVIAEYGRRSLVGG